MTPLIHHIDNVRTSPNASRKQPIEHQKIGGHEFVESLSTIEGLESSLFRFSFWHRSLQASASSSNEYERTKGMEKKCVCQSLCV
jgi:hypothetical protein